MNIKNIRFLIITAIFSLFTAPGWAGFQIYSDSLDNAKWRTSGNRLECRLSQSIPGYGKAIFTHRALESMKFSVSSLHAPRKPGQALVYVNPPEWKKYAHRKVLGRVPVNAEKEVMVLPEDWAQRMAFELREGMETVWSHADWADGQDLVEVKLRPLRFEMAWQDFQQCGENLINYGFNDVRFSAFYFPAGGSRLSAAEKAQLDRLAEYVSLDTDFEHIKISSFTDSRGLRRINKAVAQKRANMVKNYLVEKGVNPKRFVVIAQGEVKPKYNNRTKAGRAKNRRVEIQIVK